MLRTIANAVKLYLTQHLKAGVGKCRIARSWQEWNVRRDARSDGLSAIHRHAEGGGYRSGSRERGQCLVSDGADGGVEVVW